MPIIFNKIVENDTLLVIWEISESVQQLTETSVQFLSSTDLKTFNEITNERRKKEWLIVRILMRNILGKHFEILYDLNNKPSINIDKTISISHSVNLVGILISTKKNVGLDIEKISEKPEYLKQKFLSNQELIAENSSDNRLIYTLLWSAKETLYKLYGKKELIFKSDIYIPFLNQQINPEFEGFIKINNISTKYNLNYFILNDNIVVWCTK